MNIQVVGGLNARLQKLLVDTENPLCAPFPLNPSILISTTSRSSENPGFPITLAPLQAQHLSPSQITRKAEKTDRRAVTVRSPRGKTAIKEGGEAKKTRGGSGREWKREGREKQLTFYAHVRSSRRRGDEEEGSTRREGGRRAERDRGRVDARWHAPVHCRHIRLEVMAFFSTRRGRGCVPVRTRSYLNRRNQLHFWRAAAANHVCWLATSGYAVR